MILCAAVPAALALSCGIAPAEPGPAPVRRVILVSVDGLRADALGGMPTLSALRARAQWSDSMQTVVPSLTVPGHLSLLSGRDVTTFGVTSNTLDEASAIAVVMNGASSIFQWVRSDGGTTAAIIGGSLVPPAQLAMAKTFFGLDALYSAPEVTATIIDQAIGVATGAAPPQLLFVHLSAVDAAGHTAGWVDSQGAPTAGYAAAVRDVDAQLARLISALEPGLASAEVALAITADHGGGHGEGCTAGIAATHEHCTAHDGDRRIPYLLVSAGVAAGRLTGKPAITQVAPTLANLLRIERPSRVDNALWF